jgi:hypothetical protein
VTHVFRDIATSGHSQLIQLFHDQADWLFPAAFSYTATGWEPEYVRDDLKTRELRENIPEIIERVRGNRTMIDSGEYRQLGEARATVELYENGVLIHFRSRASEGVVVSLEAEAARDLAGFVDECAELLSN